MARCVRAILLAGALVLPAVADAPSPSPEPLTYYAGMPGRLTADQDAEGGNAFASALIEVWRDETVDLRDFGRRVAAVTMHKSGGWQSPEIPRRTPAPDWSFAANDAETRVALVLVNADYSQSGVSSLPGAAFDAERIPAALDELGFNVTLVRDAGGAVVDRALADFAAQSADADVAVIYMGGHGVQPGRDVYWIYGDYPDPESRGHLATHALKVSQAGKAARARKLNFVFYAACRDDPFRR